MDKILMILRQWIEGLLARDGIVEDPLAHMSPREWADMPAHHPRSEEAGR